MKDVKIWNLIMFAGMAIVTFMACDNKPQRLQPKVDETKHNKDSITRINAEAKKARMAFEDSIAVYAWGDVKFGMTQKEVLQTKAFNGAKKYDYGFAMSGANEYAIQKSLHLFTSLSIWAYFGGEKNNELIKIDISGSTSWDHFGYLTNDLQVLMAKFEVKYGKPKNVFTDLGSLKYTDLDKAKTMIVADWKLGSGKHTNGIKLIEIEMATSSETSYEYKITIYNPAFPKHPKRKTKKEIDEENKRTQNAKDVVENSF